MINWNFLYTFVVLAETLSFSETARILNTAQPVISRQIKVLEESFGAALFIRTKKRVELSSEGLDLKLRMTPLVEEIKVLLAAKKDPKAKLNCKIRMGSVNEAGRILLLPKISKFLKGNVETKIFVALASAAITNENIMKGAWDFGFVHNVSNNKSILSFPIASDTSVLIAKKGQLKTWRDQEIYPFVGYQEKDLYLEHFIKNNLSRIEQKKVEQVSSINSHDAIVQLVRQHNYMAVIPQTSAAEAVERGHVDILLQDKEMHSLYLTCHEKTIIDSEKKKFLNFLLSEFGVKRV